VQMSASGRCFLPAPVYTKAPGLDMACE
jgi:hypothetical protein